MIDADLYRVSFALAVFTASCVVQKTPYFSFRVFDFSVDICIFTLICSDRILFRMKQ